MPPLPRRLHAEANRPCSLPSREPHLGRQGDHTTTSTPSSRKPAIFSLSRLRNPPGPASESQRLPPGHRLGIQRGVGQVPPLAIVGVGEGLRCGVPSTPGPPAPADPVEKADPEWRLVIPWPKPIHDCDQGPPRGLTSVRCCRSDSRAARRPASFSLGWLRISNDSARVRVRGTAARMPGCGKGIRQAGTGRGCLASQ